jgi:hypothetical protein
LLPSRPCRSVLFRVHTPGPLPPGQGVLTAAAYMHVPTYVRV